MTRLHPMRLLMRLGISDGPAAIAIIITICLQYIFLARLWEGYPIRFMGDVIGGNVVVTMAALSILGAVTISAFSLRRWSLGVKAARRLEQPATNKSFDAIRSALATVAGRSMLPSPPALLYTPKNANALEVRERSSGADKAVVVGLDQRAYQRREPAAFAAMLGHEVSHLELGETRVEIGTRRAVTLHFRIFGWLVGMFVLLLGFIDRRGLGSAPPFAGFVPVFDATIYVQLGAQFAVLLLSSAIVFVYSYFFIVRREHIHDFRGSQLAETNALATVFTIQRADHFLARVAMAVKTFFVLHPNPAARCRVLVRHDLILLSSMLYPAVVSGLEPLILLLAAGWREFFGVSPEIWNLGLQSSRKRRTESALVENIDMAQRVIDELRQSGIRIALDDFGTGYATLAQLQTLNLDKIKIDRRFVDRVVKDRESLVIVRAILGLASGFGLTTTAEGIEEDEQRACLQANGCLEGQGYLFSEAVPASSILALLRPAPLASTTA